MRALFASVVLLLSLHPSSYAQHVVRATGPTVQIFAGAVEDDGAVAFLWSQPNKQWGISSYDPTEKTVSRSSIFGRATPVSLVRTGPGRFRVFLTNPASIAEADMERGLVSTIEIEEPERISLLIGDAAPDGASYAIVRSGQETGITRIDGQGRMEWSYAFGAPETVRLADVVATQDGGFASVGKRAGQAWILRGTAEGEILWETQIGFNRPLEATRIIPTPDGFVLGVSTHETWGTAGMLSVDPEGNVRWLRTILAQGMFQLHDLVADGDGAIHALYRISRTEGSAVWRVVFASDGQGLHAEAFGTNTMANRNTVGRADGSIIAFLDGLAPGEVVIASLDASGQSVGCDLSEKAFFSAYDQEAIVADVSTQRRSLQLKWSESATAAASPAPWSVGESCPLSVAEFGPPPELGRKDPVVKSVEPRGVNPAPPSVYVDSMSEEDFRTLVMERFRNRRFASLDELASTLRSNKVREPSWGWRLWDFYNALTPKLFPELHWNHYQEAVREWQQTFPDSETPKVVEIYAHVDRAWQARGSGLGSDVPDGGWETFGEEMRQAVKKAEEMYDETIRDPHFFTAWISAAEMLGEENEKPLNRLLEVEPGYFYGAAMATVTDMPKWGGTFENYVETMNHAVERAGTTAGNEILARLTAGLAREVEDARAFLALRIEWSRIESAYRQVIEEFPESAINWHRFAGLACIYDQREVARELFRQPLLQSFVAAAEPWRLVGYETCSAWATPPSPGLSQIGAGTGTGDGSEQTSSDAREVGAPKWITMFTSRWPNLIFRNRVQLHTGTTADQFLSFAVKYGDQTVVFTSADGLNDLWRPPERDPNSYLAVQPVDPGTAIQQHVTDWVLVSPDESTQVEGILPVKGLPRQPLPLNVGAIPGGVEVLELRREPATLEESYFVVGCRPKNGGCDQEPFAWTPKSEGGYMAGHWRMSVIPESARDLILVGAPVIDRRGLAVGIVTLKLPVIDTVIYEWVELNNVVAPDSSN